MRALRSHVHGSVSALNWNDYENRTLGGNYSQSRQIIEIENILTTGVCHVLTQPKGLPSAGFRNVWDQISAEKWFFISDWQPSGGQARTKFT